eukprot:CCRYP_018079-RA/>CCRYP_018079-RA protein AED:0.35 eAED:0.35 QI:0/0/0/1/1/1/2/0/420
MDARSLWLPVKSTWLKAIQAGNFVGWPLLTVKNVHKYYPDSAEMPQGHLNQTRKNVRSTKPKSAPFEEVHSTQLRGRKVQDIYTTTYQVRDTIFTDQTGQFPCGSQAGNKYIMVMVEIDSSAILVEPIKNRTDAELTRAYSTLMLRLRRAGIVPRKHVLDNKISAAMKDLIQDTYKMSLELVPPGCHRRNAAEVAIRNFKSHFLSILAGVADDFPLKLWDKLLPQTEITLNLLCQSNATPTVSAYAHLNGPFDYNKMPLAPMGCNAHVHEKTDSRGTWAFHSVDGCRNTRSQTAAVAKLRRTSRTQHAIASFPHPASHTNYQATTLTLDRMENEVHKALAVLDKSTGKLLNYRQLLRHPVYQGDWTISSASEFGRLAQRRRRRIKGTDTIRFIRKSDIPQDRRKDASHMAASSATSALKS